ncbi:fumarylacetoacetate hydrolase family protein [Bradyrhizobium sp. dw_411]|uniref:fumarylacetoacetate hydrolase family protein n=1 Tax=Bradyrhizobium sp. dw_411 TaxID=2720082 RepID=UPI001BCB3C69|nr:fumarylacetoacetate hydrolase family protein [Bradyrhizobium sp. dw_411]
MRIATIKTSQGVGLGLKTSTGAVRALFQERSPWLGGLLDLLREGPDALKNAERTLAGAPEIDPSEITFLPVLPAPEKIICAGLNYADHSAESGFKQPDYPTLFPRFASSLVGHGAAIVRPLASDTLDFEGEIAAIIGRGGRHIPRAKALNHVAGYALFNDASVREYQFKAPQWTVGKNFDGTGPFGPWFVSADELPPGIRGLRLVTRLNGKVVQSASTDDLVFDIATLVSVVSDAITLAPGDVIVSGTPGGVGHARMPRLYMHAGDVCEVEVDGIGVLCNPIEDEVLNSQTAAA